MAYYDTFWYQITPLFAMLTGMVQITESLENSDISGYEKHTDQSSQLEDICNICGIK